MAEHHWVIFTSSNKKKVTVRLGQSAAKMVGGGGGWETVARARDTAYVQWEGADPYRMDVPVLFDDWQDPEGGVENAVSVLNQMKMGHPPPTVRIDGAVPVKNATWVITDIDWGDDVIWEHLGNRHYARQRQDAVVHLLQFVKEDRLKMKPGIRTTPTPHRWKKGDTLRKLAKDAYGDASKWQKIASFNKIRDPSKIKVGRVIRIPV